MPSTSLERTADDTGPRRKIRKGTKSCWDCKRRKIACRFAAPEDTVCTPCKKRGTKCVGQEFPDTGRASQIDDRITRVEALLENLLERLDDAEHSTGGRERPAGHLHDTAASVLSLPRLVIEPTGQDDQVSRALLAKLPSKAELDVISGIPFNIPSCLNGLPCMQDSMAVDGKAVSLHELLRSGSHPMSVTKNVLIFSSYLQNIPQQGANILDRSGIMQYNIALNLVQAAQQHVLRDDEMVQSIEGIECLCIESAHYNTAGDLQKAWFTLRRAVLIAQVLRLPEEAHHPGMNWSGACGVGQYDIRGLWMYLVSADRYLSLMLGLPPGTSSIDIFTTQHVLGDPIQRLQRVHCLAAERITRLGPHSYDEDTSAVSDIDIVLKDAAADTGARWWTLPLIANSDPAHELSRLMSHFVHFHLLTRLHLPALIRSNDYGTSEGTAVYASREVLSRFLVFRRSGVTSYYCAGIDHLIFISCVALCVAHIKCSCTQQSAMNHQRPGDRGTMEMVLEILENTSRIGGSDISTKLTNLLRHLLDFEAEAQAGSKFRVDLTAPSGSIGCDGSLLESDGLLKLSMPSLGTVEIRSIGVRTTESSEHMPMLSERLLEGEESFGGLADPLDQFCGEDHLYPLLDSSGCDMFSGGLDPDFTVFPGN